MISTAKFLATTLVALGALTIASAQVTQASTSGAGEKVGLSDPPAPDSGNPVAQVREKRSWEFGPIINFGNGIGGDRSQYWFFAAGEQAGKILTPPVHAWIFSGQFEYGFNVQPIWQAYTPAPHDQTFIYQGQTYTYPVGGGTYTGASIMPAVFRWNFLTSMKKVQPWFQAAGGVIYTTHKFPPDVLVPHGTPGGTSVWNFSPQGGIGAHFFTGDKRSIDLSANGIHISSASLGDHNPGVNALWQIQLGYTFWR